MTVRGLQQKENLHLFGDIRSDAPVLGSWYHIYIEKLYRRVDDDIWPEEGEKKSNKFKLEPFFILFYGFSFVMYSVCKVLQ